MFSFRCKFYPNNGDAKEFFDYALSWYLSALSSNGQILGDWNLAHKSDALELACIAPEEDSLDVKHNSVPASDAYEKVLARSERKPEYELAGSETILSGTCKCPDSSSLILFTTCIHTEPPVLCADCGLHMPLYKLPRYKDDIDYTSILDWTSACRACDELFLQSGAMERFGWKQLAEHDSDLTVRGLDICKDLSAKLGKPVLYAIRTRPDKRVRNCPSCKSPWEIKDTGLSSFNLKCEACGLASIGS